MKTCHQFAGRPACVARVEPPAARGAEPRKTCGVVLLALLTSWVAPAAAQPRDSSQIVRLTTQLSEHSLRPGDHAELSVVLMLERGWHINGHALESELLIPTTVSFDPSASLTVRAIRYPEAIRRRFAFADGMLDVYEGEVRILADVAIGADARIGDTMTLTGTVRFQACNDTLCLMPAEISFGVPIALAAGEEGLSRDIGSPAPVTTDPRSDGLQSGQTPFAAAGQSGWMGGMFESQAIILWFIAALVGGLALNLTPCVYPMVPVTLAFFSAQATSGRSALTPVGPDGPVGGAQARYLASLGVLYVLGLSLTYAILGFMVAKSGALLGSWLQQPAVLIGIVAVVGVLACGMFGLYELRPPQWLTQRFGQASAGRWGALLMGMALGVIAAPCIGPFVLGLLLFVGKLANPVLGFGLLFTLGVGMGIPYLFLGVFATRISVLPKAGVWLVWSKKALGVVLVGLGLYLLRPLLPAPVFQWLCVVGLLVAAVYLGWLERSRFPGKGVWVKRLVGIALLAGAGGLLPRSGAAGPMVSWERFQPARLEQAQQAGSPVIIDVYADWCLPCVELDHVTFRNAQVIERLEDFVTLRVDATQEIPPEAEGLLEEYGIIGVPTVLFFDGQGRERPDLRLNGFLGPREMRTRLDALSR